MSKYTTQVRFICETNAKKTLLELYPDETFSENTDIEGKSVDEIISLAREKVFDFSYPIFDEEYRPELEKKILRHFYTREICAETVGLWKLWLDTRLNDIMPFYNELYKTTVLEFNPLYEVDYTTTSSKENNGTETGETADHTGTVTVRSDKANTDTNTKTFNNEDVNTREYDGAVDETTKHYNEYKETDTREYNGYKETSNEQTDIKVNNGGTQKYDRGNTSKDLFSDTPQGTVSNINIEGNSYLTNARLLDGTNYDYRTDNLEQRTTGAFDNNRNEKNIEGEIEDTKEYEGSITDTTTHRGKTIDSLHHNGTVTDELAHTGYTEDKTTYADKISKDITSHGTENFFSHVVGKTSSTSYSKLIAEFRKNILNIDKMIIDELSDLFFNLW